MVDASCGAPRSAAMVTMPGCGMGDVLRADAIRAVEMIPGVDEVDVTLVWAPQWNIGRMSEAARLQLGML